MPENKGYKHYCNRSCEYFPCHKDVDAENFSCMFCYCPLYPLKKCGGNYTYTKKGIKDCSACTMPHDPANYEKVMEGCGKVCREFGSKRRQRCIRAAICMLLALIMGALCIVLPSVLLSNAWRITEAMDIPEVTQVLAQLADTRHTGSFIVAGICALLTFIISVRLHRNKIFAAILILIVFILCLPAALLLTESNGVPVYTIVQILLEYLESGAF